MTCTRNLAGMLGLCMLFVSGASSLSAQDAEPAVEVVSAEDLEELDISPQEMAVLKKYMEIEWDVGPTSSSIGTDATIKVPEGYKLTGAAGSRTWDELTHNPPSDTLATLMPDSEDWFVCFTFSNDGYVKDDEADELDADAILESLKQGTESSNAYRQKQGWGSIHVTDWIVPPKFDDETKHLVWAFGLRNNEGGESANYNMRVLGRYGVMNVVVVAEPAKMNSAVDEANQLLTGFNYNDGHKYAEFQEGDRIAEYGLTGLIAGGALVAAAKTGLLGKLAKFAKVIVLGVIAVIGGIWRFLTGQTKQET